MRLVKQAGFTLFEILITLLILGIVAVLMVRGLQIVVTAKHRLEHNAERLTSMSLVISLLGNDLRNAINRPITVANNTELAPVILQGDGRQTLEFTRGAVANPLARHRSTLLRVAYQLSQGQLIRLTWQVLDRAAGSEPSTRVLLHNVQYLKWEFLGSDNRYYLSWPDTNASGQPLPKAIRVSLTIKDWGTVTRLFIVNNTVIKQAK